MMLANAHFTPVLGIDIHFVLVPTPAGPVPTPLPHPFIGMVLDPMDYIPPFNLPVPFIGPVPIGSRTKVNGLHKGNAGTAGILNALIHLPIGGPTFATPPLINHDSSNFFGSTRVNAEGSYMTPAGFMVMTCNDIGMPLTLKPGETCRTPIPGRYLPLSASIPLPAGRPVMVGGPYAPDLMTIIMSLAMSFGFGCLMRGASRALTRFNHMLPSTSGLRRALCRLGFEPVDLVTGRMLYDGEDFEIPGVIPIKWKRSWYSDSAYKGPMGHGFHCNYDLALHILEDECTIAMRLPDGRITSFPCLIGEGESFYNRFEKLTLTYLDIDTYTVRDHTSNLTNTFKRISGDLFKPESLGNDDGFSIKFFYDAQGALEQIIDTAGRRINIGLDNEGRIAEITAAHEGEHRYLVGYSYNEEGDLIGITDALGQTTSMEYENHLMIKKTDRNGQAFYWEYDGKSTGSKCVRTWGDGGILSGTIQYGDGQNWVTNSLGETTIYYFDENKLCNRVTNPEGGDTYHEFTDFMEPYRDIDEEGNTTGYTYDARGNLTGIHHPDGAVTTFMYDKSDRLVLTKTPGGKKSIRTYKKGKLHATSNADGSVTIFGYNEMGLVNSIRDNSKSKTRLEYDTDHNLVRMLLPNGGTSSWDYDAWGNCIKITNSEKHRQQFSYDALGRVLKVQLADDNTITMTYNAYDEVVETIDSKKRKVAFEYTPMGSLKMHKENDTKVHFKYNTEEQLMAIINEHEDYYRFGRNKKGEIINETGFDGLRRDFLRDRAGKVLKVLRPDNRFTEYEYDLNGRIIRSEHSDGTWETFSYNPDGLLVEAVNQNSKVLMNRDQAGKILSEDQDGHLVESSYDKQGNRIHIQSSLGADIQIERTKMGLVQEVQASNSLAQEQNEAWSARISYNSVGQELERLLPGGICNRMNYDKAGRPMEHSVSRSNRELRHRTYSWNVNDQLRTMVDNLTKGAVNYTYDAFGNLATARYENGQFDYKLPDEVGNLYRNKDQSDRKYGPGGQLLEANGNTYSYDKEGNLIEKSTSSGVEVYEWYGNGMLQAVTKPNGDKISFEYDALGRRTAKIVVPRMPHKKRVITRFVWDGNVPLHEWKYDLRDRPEWVVDEFGFLIKDKEEPITFTRTEANQDGVLITWVFDEGTFRPAAKMVDGEHFSIITDYLGTPVEMYNTKGEKTWAAEYDMYGKIRTLFQGSLMDCPFRFQGQYEDVETGLYYNRFRYYSANGGSYLSKDFIGFIGDNSNLYSYIHDSNILIDPLGLAPWENGGFNEWFNNASVQDIIDNKQSVESALRGNGGMHEMFPVSEAARAKELGFTAEELRNMTVETDRITFTGVKDSRGHPVPDGGHHNTRAGRHFHNKLIRALRRAKTKIGALRIINRIHNEHMRLKCKS
ncbi:DUF6531 domain-containing protein [Pareuzebyella sediminis]|uniref:DUF6531 domain-containing protein n=1 Tax=Pareuzebyella sediminis TaxID=2607998 RepID=UPI0011EDB139|nr:DUF6531 domain-containing protein [Pareuzebyella sediminis]